MKLKKFVLSILLLSSLSAVSCSGSNNNFNNGNNVTDSNTIEGNESSDTTNDVNSGGGVDSTAFSGEEVTSDFSLTTSDGNVTTSGTTYTITKAGTYTASGKLTGQIYINAGDSDEIELDLAGVSITNSTNSPIFISNASKVEISAKTDTYNVITDSRSNKTSDSETQGEGAIYAKADLKLKGSGTLKVIGNYNNGVHTSKDLSIQKESLFVQAYNNAIKGNHKVNIESGTLLLYSTNGDGIKTEDTDLSNSGNQRGSVNISGGNIEIYSAYDGIDAAYDVNIYNGVDDSNNTTKPTVTIYTNEYMQYGSNYSYSKNKIQNTFYAGGRPGGSGGSGFPGEGGSTGPGSNQGVTSKKATDSAKSLKAENKVYIKGGSNYLFAYDDCIHANSGTTFSSGSVGVGNVEIAGGNTTIYASDDGIHADNNVILSGGETTVGCAYEGIEATKTLSITGGTHYVYASDDGLNASGSISVTDGFMFVGVPTSGDVDTIDSNGSYSQSGGVVMAIGPNQGMASCLDVDGSASVTGGSFICFGALETKPTAKNVTTSSKSGSYSFTSSQTVKVNFASGSVTGLYLTISSSTTSNLATAGTLSSSICNAYSSLGSISSIDVVK